MVSVCIKIVNYESVAEPRHFPSLIFKHKTTILVRGLHAVYYPTVVIALNTWTV